MELVSPDDNGTTNTRCKSVTLKVNPNQMVIGGYVETCEVAECFVFLTSCIIILFYLLQIIITKSWQLSFSEVNQQKS